MLWSQSLTWKTGAATCRWTNDRWGILKGNQCDTDITITLYYCLEHWLISSNYSQLIRHIRFFSQTAEKSLKQTSKNQWLIIVEFHLWPASCSFLYRNRFFASSSLRVTHIRHQAPRLIIDAALLTSAVIKRFHQMVWSGVEWIVSIAKMRELNLKW